MTGLELQQQLNLRGIVIPVIFVTGHGDIPMVIESMRLGAFDFLPMAERGQIVGGILDGPLGFDNAISSEAARTKGICSPVAGQVDILVVPDLEAGNMLVKQLIYLAGAEAAGIVLGARISDHAYQPR